MNVIITGGSRGIGRACVLYFTDRGHNVVFSFSKSKNEAEQLVLEVSSRGRGKAVSVCADAALPESAELLVNACVSSFGSVDVLVNNAGISGYGLVQDTSVDDYRQMIAVCQDSQFYTARCALTDMLRRHKGTIVNVSSMWGTAGASCEVAYSMAKAGVIGLTKALAKEVGLSGIRVNAVAPGVIATDMNKCHSEETLSELAAATPLGRIGAPEEVAAVIYFLASEDSSFVTGQVIGVDGGFAV